MLARFFELFISCRLYQHHNYYNTLKMDMEIEEVKETKKPTGLGSDLPWVEKYRPTDIKDVVGNEETLSRLQIIAEEGNLPNIIITVSPEKDLK
jgi:hypothetical protein